MKRKRTKGTRKLAARRRRHTVGHMLEQGRSVAEMARVLGCPEQTVRRHIAFLREQARERAAEEWGPGGGETADLVESLEGTLQKVRAAQAHAEKESSYRSLLLLEVQTIRELIAARRDIAMERRNRTQDDDALFKPLDEMSDAELLQCARDVGVDTRPFEAALTGDAPR